MKLLLYPINRFGRSALRVLSVLGLVLILIGGSSTSTSAASITLPSSYLFSCDAGVEEPLPGPIFADGGVDIELRCNINRNHTNYAAFVTAFAGGTYLTSALVTIWPGGGNAACSSLAPQTATRGAFVNSAGVETHTALSPLPANYISISFRCSYTVGATSRTTFSFGTLQIAGFSAASSGNYVKSGYSCNDRYGVGGSSLCVRDLTDPGEAFNLDNYASSPDWFGAYTGPVLGPCRDHVEFSYYLNDESIDLVESMNVTVEPEDELRIAVGIGGSAYPSELTETSFAWRAGPGLNWRVGLQLATDPVTIVGHTVLAFNLDVGGGFALGQGELRCTDVEGVHYLDSGNNWNETERPNRACSAITAKLPTTEHELGDTVTARYSIKAGPYEDDDEWVSLRFLMMVDGVPEETLDVESFTVYGTQHGGGAPFTDELPMTPNQGELRFDMPITGDPSRGFLWCTDSTGETRIWGAGTPVSGTFHGTVNESQACYSGAGMTVAPSTWLRGFARMGTCLAGELVVPSGDVISEAASETMAEVEDVPPFSFFIAATVFVDTAQESFQDPSGSGCFDLGGMVPGTAQDDVCMGSGVVTAGTSRAIIAMLLVGGIYLSILMHGVSLVREK